MSTYLLYGSQASLFTGKARGYLRWKGVPFDEYPVTADVMESVILPTVGWPVIPVMQTPDGRIVQDTADIIAEVEAAHPPLSVMPKGPLQCFVSYLFQLNADEWLTLPAMHYRWNYNEEWIYSEFGRSGAPDASTEEQYRIGKERGQRFRGMVPMLGINDETIPGIEASYEAFLAEFSAHLDQHAYVFGGRPSFADFALLGPLYAHLYRDPASGEIMKRLAPKVADWTERTIAGEPGSGDLVGDDVVPETLLPLMRRHFTEHLPVLGMASEALAKWAESADPGTEVPRGFDLAPLTVEGHTGMGMLRAFSLFRLQDALDALGALTGDDRARADALLDRTGGEALKAFKLPVRLERKNYRLVLAG